VKLPLNYTKLPKPGFDAKVELDLGIAADGKTLEGTWKNSLGRKGPVRFVRVASEAAPKVTKPAEVPAGEGPVADGEKKEEPATP